MQRNAVFTALAAFAILLAPFSANGEVVIGPNFGMAHEIPPGDQLISELNCVSCHKATARQADFLSSRTAPLLGKGGMRITPQYLRRYLSNPAGFKPGTTMPNMLHGISAAEKADAVDALVHYLISEEDEASGQGISAEEYLIRQGRALYHTIGCVACHEPQAAPEMVPGSTTQDPESLELDASLKVPASVPLGDLARKTTVEELARFLAAPMEVRPSGRMPSHNLTAGEARSIAVYLLRAQAKAPGKERAIDGLKYRYFEQQFGPKPDFDSLTPVSSGVVLTFSIEPKRRNEYFGFHFSGTIRIPRTGRYTFYTSTDDGSQLFVDGKLVVDNSGDHAPQEREGNVELAAGEHPIVVTFYNNGAGYEFYVFWKGPDFDKQEIPTEALSHIGQPMEPLDEEEFVLNREKAAKGRELFASLGCAACHEVSGQKIASNNDATPLSDLAGSAGGCLAEQPPARAARFDLSGEQRQGIISALERKRFDQPQSEKERVSYTLARMNCFACHTRGAKGGPSDARLAYFRMNADVDMGDEGRIPPHLTGVGGKLRPEWTREVLLNGGRVRPYMATRMPQFGERHVGHLAEAFVRADVSQERSAPDFTLRDSKFGRRLAGVGGLACISCHTFAGHKSLGIPALDMITMAKRLRYDWFYRYLINPPSLRPGTRMPTFWPNGQAVNTEILDGNTEAQITALWAYFSSDPRTDLPAGLIQGQKEIVAESEPVIYRNFIRGAGTRAIGVGYPEKVNLAFDANNQRLAILWQGPSIAGARHSAGGGEGFEPPLGHNVLKMPEGPPFAILADAEAPWPSESGRDAGFRMIGYSLDELRRPTFAYEFHGLRIEGYFEPVMGEIDANFRRTFRVIGSDVKNLWFRAATGDLSKNGDLFLLDKKVQIKFTGAKAKIRESGGTKELIVPVDLENGGATFTQEIIW